MKNYNTSELSELVEYYEDSAYVRTDELEELAEELAEESEDIEDIQSQFLIEIECDILRDYQYIECENQGSYYRHIWHKINE